MILALAVLVRGFVPRKTVSILWFSGVFALYAAAVNVVWMLQTGDLEFLLYGSHYVLNFGVCVVFLILYQWVGASFVLWTGATLLASLVIQLCLVGGSGPEARRGNASRHCLRTQTSWRTIRSSWAACTFSRFATCAFRGSWGWRVRFFWD